MAPAADAAVPKMETAPDVPGVHLLRFVILTGAPLLNTPSSEAHVSAAAAAIETTKAYRNISLNVVAYAKEKPDGTPPLAATCAQFRRLVLASLSSAIFFRCFL